MQSTRAGREGQVSTRKNYLTQSKKRGVRNEAGGLGECGTMGGGEKKRRVERKEEKGDLRKLLVGSV